MASSRLQGALAWLAVPACGIATLLGCQEPFGADRHELLRDRIAAIVTEPAVGGVTARPVLLVAGRLWSDTPVDLAWYPAPDAEDADDVDAVDAEGVPEATGAEVVLPPGTHVLVAAFPSGSRQRALFTVPDVAVAMVAPTRVEVALVDIDFDEPREEDLTVEARASLDPESVLAVPPGAWARLTAAWDAEPPAGLDRVRWMGTTPTGTFLELDRTTTDWASGEVLFDDLEVEEATPMKPTVVAVLALALDGEGGNAATVWDVQVGEAPSVARIRGRLIDAEGATGARLVGRLEADDEATAGVRLVDVLATDAPVDALDADGADALGCGVAGPFDPMWLVDARCTRAQVLGHVVAVRP